jgi:hypothetical protein
MKVSTVAIITFFLISSFRVSAQYIHWARTVGGPDYEFGVKTDVDDNGNVYTVGYSLGSIEINGKVINPQPNGRGDAFITKHNANGDLLWVKTFGGNDPTYYDQPQDVHLDKNGDCYILCSIPGGSTFDGGSFEYDGVVIEGIDLPRYESGSIILKVDSNGKLLWHQFALVYSLEGIDSDFNGNIYVSGFFYGSGIIGGVQLKNPTNGTTSDMFLARFSSEGQLAWIRQIGGKRSNSHVFLGDVALTKDKEYLYLMGNYRDTAYFKTATLAAKGTNAVFLAKYDTTGAEQWVIPIDSGVYRFGTGLDVSTSGNVGVVGFFSLGKNNNQSFWGIYDSDGKVLKRISPVSSKLSNMYGISFSDSSYYYVSGYFQNDLTFNDTTLMSDGGKNYGEMNFVAKIDSNHQIKWIRSFPSTKWESHILYKDNNIYFTNRIDYPLFVNRWVDSLTGKAGEAVVMKIVDTNLLASIHAVETPVLYYIYPNPASGIVTISNAAGDITQLRLVNVLGETVKAFNSFENIRQFDISHLPTGQYQVIATLRNKQQKTFKLTKL